MLIRSATHGDRRTDRARRPLRVIGRAGTGVDNVDIEAATKRGILVVNAPESNSVAAAEHTLAMALALSPQRARRRTARWSPARGTARATPETSSTARRWA